MPASIGQTVAGLQRGSDSVARAAVDLAGARSLAEELYESAVAMELLGLADRVAAFIARIGAVMDAMTSLQLEADAARVATTGPGLLPGMSSTDRPAPPDPTRSGALGGAFRIGVHDPEHLFLPKEHTIAEFLVARGAGVHARPVRRTRDGEKNPDVIVRYSPQDVGTVMEFKTLDAPTHSAVKRNIKEAAIQLSHHEGSAVVIDGRAVNLEEAA